jgi:metallo-beta-lactamase family protein
MRIRVMGAAGGEVTGSAYVVEANGARVLVDCGLFQGGKDADEKNHRPLVEAAGVDALLLTHAHLDHTGRVPLLIKGGYSGPIYTTAATVDLADIVLKDSAKLQTQDAERMTRKRQGKGEPPVEPLYTVEHTEAFRGMTRPVHLHETVDVAKGITARWFEAGHMLGSGSIELSVENKTVVFSGDLGPLTFPILREYERLKNADFVFLESTYGDRDHRPYAETVAQFGQIVAEVAAQRGKILVPTFAIGRAQQIIYHLAILFAEGRVKRFPIYLDSPMAIEASKVFARYPDLYDEDLLRLKRSGTAPLDPKWFTPSVTADDSKKLNDVEGPCMILAGAGMCTGGRILHHLKANLANPQTHVMIVGFQSEGSLGRRLVNGEKLVRIHGEEVPVNAAIHTLNGFSAHAGQTDLLNWLAPLAQRKPKLALTHGEQPQRNALAAKLRERFGIQPRLPQLGEVIEL